MSKISRALALLVCLFGATPVFAAYTTATVNTREAAADRVHVNVTFTGNAGEPAVTRDLYSTSLTDLQAQVAALVKQLNQVLTDTASITVGQPMSQPGPSANPANGATGVSTTPTLTWNLPGAVSYDIAFSTVNPPTTIVGSGLTVASFSPGTLAANTQYFWRVRWTDSGSTVRLSPIVSFTTAAAPTPPVVTAQQQFFADLTQFYAVDQAVQAGIVSASDATYVALKQKAVSEFVTDYVSVIGWPRR